MKRFLFIAILCAAPVAASAAVAPAPGKSTAVSSGEKVRVTDYYKGNKVCRRVGSATVCN